MIKTIDMMLRRHPSGDRQHTADYVEALESLEACASICTSCADACLGESEHLGHLRGCISTALDCADICAATARVVTRQTEAPNALVQAQLHSCVLACQICSDECEQHAEMHEHCRICAETCHHCQERCNFLLGEISASGIADSESEESPPLR